MILSLFCTLSINLFLHGEAWAGNSLVGCPHAPQYLELLGLPQQFGKDTSNKVGNPSSTPPTGRRLHVDMPS
ncbi:hypothetical protein F5Y16DRAFT_373912 [Xylariaceae sp. FL0255]|nr:hypothetical protein F5Y16DRAFT_373912 [Xylariaceae sp. FL0255]